MKCPGYHGVTDMQSLQAILKEVLGLDVQILHQPDSSDLILRFKSHNPCSHCGRRVPDGDACPGCGAPKE